MRNSCSSHTYTGGWAYASPPRTLLHIDRRTAYVRYLPNGYVSGRPERHHSYRSNGPVIRDHRDDRYRDTRDHDRSRIDVRDHRDDDRDRRSRPVIHRR
ncbi:MAG TPA: hypothetical protein VK427_19390 [Kofleriaceae bacterium]|nr:hypothetical protein [Kofleriaceae bacterium]